MHRYINGFGFAQKETAVVLAEGSIGLVIAVALVLGLVIYRLSLRLGDSLRHQAATRDVLQLVGNATADLDTVLATLVKTSLEICRADAAGILRPNASGGNDIAEIGLPERYQDYLRNVALEDDPDTLIGRTVQERKAVRILDAYTDAALADAPERQFFRSWLGIPLIMGGRTVAVMVLAPLYAVTVGSAQPSGKRHEPPDVVARSAVQ